MSDERLRIIMGFSFGLATLVSYLALALVIALGHIEEKTSFGLTNILSAIGPLGGMFCAWAFGNQGRGSSSDEQMRPERKSKEQ